jgi:site-specific recombinase XerD
VAARSQTEVQFGGKSAPNTVRAYRSDWADFSRWAGEQALGTLPASPDTVARYVEDLARRGRRASTIRRRLSAIAHVHADAELDQPTRHPAVRRAAREAQDCEPSSERGKTPLRMAELRSIVTGLPESLAGARDRALLLLGFAGALRRREIVGLDTEDVEEHRFGLRVHVRRRHTGGALHERTVEIPFGSHPATCPVLALRAWLDGAGIVSGPLFRSVSRGGRPQARRLSDKSVVLVLKRAAKAAGLDPRKYAAHSLRSGLAVAAATAGATERSIMAQTGYRSAATVRRYVTLGQRLENAAALAGL